jgi:prophage maintenance system killer protein
MPQAGIANRSLHAHLFERPAACTFHLFSHRPFLDGDKRIGAEAAVVLPDLIGLALTAPSASRVHLVLDVADGKADKARFAAF